MSRDSLTDQLRAVRDKVRPSGHLSRSKDSSRLNRNDVIHLPSWGVVQVVKNNDTDFYGGEIDTGHRPFLFFHKSQRIGLPGLKIQDARGKSILYIQGENPDSTRPGLRAIEWCFVEDVDWCYSPPPASQEEYDKLRTEILVGTEFNVLLKLIRGELFQRCPDRVQDRVLRVALLQRVKQIAQNRSWARSFLEAIEKSPYRDIRVWLLILMEHFDASDLSVLPCQMRYLAHIGSENHKSKLIEWGLRRHGDPDFPAWMRLFSNHQNAKLEILDKLLKDDQWRSFLLREWSNLKPWLPNPASWIQLLPELQRSAFLEIDDPDLGILKIACLGIALDLETDGEQIWQIGVAEVGGNKETLYDAKGNTPPLDEALQTLADRLKSKRFVVGHNIALWDAPVLAKINPVLFDTLPPLWDTLLLSCLVSPWKRSHALNSNHQAAEDAAACIDRFLDQIKSIGSAVNDLMLSNTLGTTELLQRVGTMLEDKPIESPSNQPWSQRLLGFDNPNSITFLPRPLLRQFYWNKLFAPVEIVGARAQHLDPLKLADGGNTPWVTVARSIISRGRRNGLSIIPDMLPPSLQFHEGMGNLLTAALTDFLDDTRPQIAVHPNTRANINSFNRNMPPRYYLGAESGLIIDETILNTPPIGWPNQNPRPTAPALYRHDGQMRSWHWFDPLPATIANGRCWRTFSTWKPFGDASSIDLPTDWKVECVVPNMPDRVLHHPTTTEQKEYWIEVTERFLAVARAAYAEDPMVVPILFLASVHNGIVVEKLESAFVEFDVSEFPQGRSRMERIRRAVGRKKLFCTVDFVSSMDEWLTVASELGIRIRPVIESLPMVEWYALNSAESNSTEDDDLSEDGEGGVAESADDRESDGETDEETGEDGYDDPTPPTEKLEQANTLFKQVSHAKIIESVLNGNGGLLERRIGAWLQGLGVPAATQVVLLDPRLNGIRLKLQQLSFDPPFENQRSILERVLDSLQPQIEREVADSTVEVLQEFLQQNWGYESFQPWQQPAVDAIAGYDADVLVTLPTGGGKSILFQVPALYRGEKRRTLSLVISPLRALMHDQVEDLHKHGFFESVDYLSADRPQHENEAVYQGILDHRITLLYVSPERFRNRRFLELLDYRFQADKAVGGFEFFIFDEAHCIGQWGYEFRPDYFHAFNILRSDRYRLPDGEGSQTPFLFFSATVTARTRVEIKGNIEARQLRVVPDEYFHPIREHIVIQTAAVEGNIGGSRPGNWDIGPRIDAIQTIVNKALDNRAKTSAVKSAVIIFVSRRDHAEELAFQLSKHYGKLVDYFHAGLDAESRHEVYEGFKKGNLDILVATKAFGMGMDIGHIHWAIHLSPPSYLEDYFQEIGRIGRNKDDMAAAGLKFLQATLLHSPDDFSRNLTNIQRSWIDFPQLDGFLKNIQKETRSLNGAYIALIPDIGFDTPNTHSARRAAVTRVRVMLHWMEKMKRIGLLQQLPGLLRVRINQQQLKIQSTGDSRQAEVARCLLAIPPQPNEQTNPPGDNLLDRVIKGLDRFFGFLFGQPPAKNDVPQPSAAMPNNDEALIDLCAISRRVSSSIFDLLKVLSELQKAGALTILRDLHFSIGRLQRQMTNEQQVAFLDHLLNSSVNVVRQIAGLGSVEITNDMIGTLFEANDAQGKAIDLGLPSQKGLTYLLRVAGARTRQKTVVENDIPRQGLFATIEANRSQRVSMRIVTLAKSIARLIAARIPDGGNLKLHDLLQVLHDDGLPGQGYRQRELQQALGLLAATRLIYCREPLVPMTYVLEVHSPDTEFLEQNYPNELDELDEVNRLAELRAHAMEVFVALPDEARDAFVEGYFANGTSSELEKFIGEEILNISDSRSSSWASQKLAQVRHEGIAKLFDRYRSSDAQSPTQWEAISHPWNQHLLVNAGPGSGKTSVLLARVAHLIHEQGLKPENIMVLAFNRAVVFEIRSRIRDLFHQLGYGLYVRRLQVSTFHALATRHLGRIDDDSNMLGRFATLLTNDAALTLSIANGVHAILVDEFQDANPDILSIIQQLQAASGAFVMAIGDDDQDVLRWNRLRNHVEDTATEGIFYFEQFRQTFQPVSEVTLTVNFRSAPQIVEKSQSLINKAIPGRLKAHIELRAAQGAINGSVFVPNDQTTFDEKVSQWLRDKAIQYGNESIAILCRTNAEVVSWHRRLQAQLPRLRLLQKNADLKIDRLRHVACLCDICKTIIGAEGDLTLANCRNELLTRFSKLEIPEARNQGQAPLPLDDILTLVEAEKSSARLSHVIEFAESAKIDECLWMLDKRSSGNEVKPAVISTMHKVKGLEFDRVVVVPSQTNFTSNAPGDSLEEARLFYVALTRAKQAVMFRFDQREWAWWRNENFDMQQAINGQQMLEGSPEEVQISWAANANNRLADGAQDYIEREVGVGDTIRVRGRWLDHVTPSGECRQIGALAGGRQGSDQSSLLVSAVIRYTQQEGDNEYFQRLTQQVQVQRWSYVALVSGSL